MEKKKKLPSNFKFQLELIIKTSNPYQYYRLKKKQYTIVSWNCCSVGSKEFHNEPFKTSKNRLQVLFLFKNTFKNVWFTRAKFHKKFIRYYGVIEKNLFRQERRGEISNSLTPFLFRLPEGANKDFLHSFTLDALSRQNNCNLCGCSLSSLTGSNAMISNNISYSSMLQ